MKNKSYQFIFCLAFSLSALSVPAASGLDNEKSISNYGYDALMVEEKVNFIPYDFYTDYIRVSRRESASYLMNLIDEYGTDIVLIENNNIVLRVPMATLMLVRDREDDAIILLENGYNKPFQLFDFGEGQNADLITAIELNRYSYFLKSIDKIDDVNKRFNYNGEDGFTLLMVAAMNKSPQNAAITKKLLEKGANKELLSHNGLSAVRMAQINQNRVFLDVISDFETESVNNVNVLQTNNKQSLEKIRESDRIVENFKNGILDEIMESGEYNEALFSMILNGYHKPANVLLDRIIAEDKFDPNYINDSEASFLFATALSSISGGDVEMAARLIELGADVSFKNSEGITAAEIAIARDSHKIVFILFENGFNIFEAQTSSGEDLFTFSLTVRPVAVRTVQLLNNILEIMIEGGNNQE